MGMRYVFALLLALGGCQTPYQPEGFGGGYEDIRLSDDTFEIRARGNGYSSEAHTRNIVLLRASELAIQNGFSHFMILDGSMKSTERTFTTPGSINTTGQASVYGNTIYGTSNSIYTPPQAHRVTNQHGAALVKMFRGPAPNALDAQLIYNQLHPKLAK